MTTLPDPRDENRPNQPDIEEIIHQLEMFRPFPGPGLQTRVASSPWDVAPFNSRRKRLSTVKRGRLYAVAAALVVVLLALVFASTPGGRAAAAQLARFFQRSDSDFARITLHRPVAQGNQGSFPLSLAEAVALAGYPIWRPGSAPPGLVFNGAKFDPALDTVIQDYSSENRLEVLRISQSALGDQERYTTIGGSAQVGILSLGDVNAEYVSGSWKLQDPLPPIAAGASSGGFEVTATWDPAAHVQLLRWQQDGFLFEILYVGGNPHIPGNMTKTMLADLASGLKP